MSARILLSKIPDYYENVFKTFPQLESVLKSFNRELCLSKREYATIVFIDYKKPSVLYCMPLGSFASAQNWLTRYSTTLPGILSFNLNTRIRATVTFAKLQEFIAKNKTFYLVAVISGYLRDYKNTPICISCDSTSPINILRDLSIFAEEQSYSKLYGTIYGTIDNVYVISSNDFNSASEAANNTGGLYNSYSGFDIFQYKKVNLSN